LVSRCSERSGTQRILIDRLRGMEDSSRYRSISFRPQSADQPANLT
jgi:hypothetical protein